MNDTQKQVQAVLNELKQEIIYLVGQGQLDDVDFLMEQYIKLAAHSIDRYSLEAIINIEKGDLKKANDILLEGAKHHPISFDLLYNLGYTFQHLEEPFEAYNIYMKAKYVAETEDEKEDIYNALKSLVDDFSGYVRIVDKDITTVIQAGKLELTLTQSYDELIKRKNLIHLVADNIFKDSDDVLEIGFEDGAISRNLNFFGYNVTAVDPIKEKIINVILREWHGSILQPEEKSAKFYQEEINTNWVNNIPKFDTIIAIAENNLQRFQAKEDTIEILESLIIKSRNQLIIRVSKEESDTEFTRNGLLGLIDMQGLQYKLLYSEEKREEIYEIYSINKNEMELFKIPTALGVLDSKSTVFEIDINKCKDLFGAGYIDDFHPFVEVLKEYDKNPQVRYEDTILKKYYDTFKPNNLEEGLFSKIRKAPRLRQGWIGYPWAWDSSLKVIFTEKLKDTRPGGIHFFGPNTKEFGEAELERLKNLYDNLKIQGYSPEIFSDGYISGYFLVKASDYRFIVTEGQHRIAALAALGYDKILCKFTQKPEYNQIVDLEDIKKWPQVENKVYSRNLATRIFWRFFEEGVGRDRMEF